MDNMDRFFKIKDHSGKEIECEELAFASSKETNRKYIIYTDNTVNDEGKTNVYAGIVDEVDGKSRISQIESDDEWKCIETIFEMF